MKLIFAQGNPGDQYAKTRHNVGFIVLDELAEKNNASWRLETKFKALITDITIAGEKVLLAKPTTYYNETGGSARAIVDFYKLNPASDVLVIHDELALPFGTIRTRQKGSDAGNNGIKSLNAHLGPDYARIRIGVWNELRDRINDADFVLSRFTASETAALQKITAAIAPWLDQFARETLEPTSASVELSL